MTVVKVPTVSAPAPGKPKLDNVPELQALARRVAVEGEWSADLAAIVEGIFDGQAADWNAEHSVGRFDPVDDALRRGGAFAPGRCLEVGSGTGQITPLLAARFDQVVSIDLSAAMLKEAAGSPSSPVRCDASRMPFADAVFDAAVLVDMFCFAEELARVLVRDGVVVWINVLGEDGPLYVPAEDIARALPGGWHGVESTAGWGTWAVLRRSEVSGA